MAWRLIGQPVTQLVTPELATRFCEMEPAPQDRPLSERRLTVYEKMARAGQFRPVTWAYTSCLETGATEIRVNGKHTSTLMSRQAEEKSFPPFFAVIEQYECDTLEDVAKLYGTFDSKMQSRTARDIYLSFAGTVSEFRGVVTDHNIGLACTGMGFQHFGPEAYPNTTAMERAELLLEFPEFVLWMHTLMQAGPLGTAVGVKTCRRSAHMDRMAVIAAMFATWMKSAKDAEAFWVAVRDETGKTPECPDRKLARYLMVTGLRRESTKTHGGGSREMFVKCLHAWNAWRKGQPTNLRYQADTDIPKVL